MISMSWLRRNCLKFFIMRVYFWNAWFVLFGLKGQLGDSSLIILVNTLWVVYTFWKKIRFSHGHLTIGCHLWVLDFKMFNDSDGLYFLSLPLECVCFKICEGGNRELCTAHMTAKPLRPNVLSQQRLRWTHSGLSRQILTGCGLLRKSLFFFVEVPPTEETSWDPPALLGTWAVGAPTQSSVS